eukprot:jgi/Hompol1/6080/HPOL_000611-RA
MTFTSTTKTRTATRTQASASTSKTSSAASSAPQKQATSTNRAAKKTKSAAATATKTASESSTPCPNQDIIDLLNEVAQNEVDNGNQRIAISYWNAIRTIKAQPARFTSGSEARKLKGIGEKIAAKIDEILATVESGTLKRVQRDRAKAKEDAEKAAGTSQWPGNG